MSSQEQSVFSGLPFDCFFTSAWDDNSLWVEISGHVALQEELRSCLAMFAEQR